MTNVVSNKCMYVCVYPMTNFGRKRNPIASGNALLVEARKKKKKKRTPWNLLATERALL